MIKLKALVVLACLCFSVPAHAFSDEPHTALQPHSFISTIAIDPEQPPKEPIIIDPPVVVAKKERFSVRHSKVWNAYRKARKFAIKTKPWVDYAGSCAQVTYSIVQFFI